MGWAEGGDLVGAEDLEGVLVERRIGAARVGRAREETPAGWVVGMSRVRWMSRWFPGRSLRRFWRGGGGGCGEKEAAERRKGVQRAGVSMVSPSLLSRSMSEAE